MVFLAMFLSSRGALRNHSQSSVGLSSSLGSLPAGPGIYAQPFVHWWFPLQRLLVSKLLPECRDCWNVIIINDRYSYNLLGLQSALQ